MALAVTQEFGTDVLILDRRCAADGEDSDQQASPWQDPRLYARHFLSPFPVSVARGCISRKAIANAYKRRAQENHQGLQQGSPRIILGW
jgi:hypothetical protein